MSEAIRDPVERQATEEQTVMLPSDNGSGGSGLNDAVAFLRDKLADGPVSGKDVYRAAESIGISKRSLERAKSQISVITRRVGEKGKRGGGIWTWGLPADLHHQDGDLNNAMSENDLHRHIVETGSVNQNHTCQTGNAISVGGFNDDSALTPKADAAADRREAILGMPADRAIEIWRSRGSPVFSSRQGEHLRDLDSLLSNPDCQERHLKVVRAWLDKFCSIDDPFYFFNSYIRL